MRSFSLKPLLIAALLLTLTGCTGKALMDIIAKYRAIVLSKEITQEALQFCYEWNYTDLGGNGNVGVWVKFSGDTMTYLCEYAEVKDTQKIRCGNLDEFYSEFPVAVHLDKDEEYRALEFATVGDVVRVSGINYMDKATFINAYRKGDLFMHNDPVEYFKKLQQWKRGLGIDGVRYYPAFGNYLRFDLPGNYEAVYLPTDLWVKEDFQPEFNAWISKGIKIQDNWRLFYTGGLQAEKIDSSRVGS